MSKRDAVVRVRLPAAGKAALAARAARLGMNMSEYVRLSVTRDLLQDLTQQPVADFLSRMDYNETNPPQPAPAR